VRVVIRTGISRTVVLVGRWAVKIPTGRGVGLKPRSFRGRLEGVCRGLLANLSEHEWHTYEPWAGGVAPVLHSWVGGLVQVYPRCEPLDVVDDDAGRATLPRLDPDPGDVKVDNYGRLNGRVVRVDYEMT
jgi:hypothetical protein